MPRNYDRLIKFYDSWFDDLLDPEKEFSAEEFRIAILAIRDAQHECDVTKLDSIPPSVRRGLSMATLKEQLSRILERAEGARNRGRKGGEAARAALSPEQAARAADEAARKRFEEQRQASNTAYYKKCAQNENTDLVTWMKKPRTEEDLRKMWEADPAAKEVTFEYWVKYRGF